MAHTRWAGRCLHITSSLPRQGLEIDNLHTVWLLESAFTVAKKGLVSLPITTPVLVITFLLVTVAVLIVSPTLIIASLPVHTPQQARRLGMIRRSHICAAAPDSPSRSQLRGCQSAGLALRYVCWAPLLVSCIA
jgi:hypothetical protein